MPRPLTPAVFVLAGALVAGPGQAATLERLSMDEMIQKSTEIVRGRVMTLGVSTRGSILHAGAGGGDGAVEGLAERGDRGLDPRRAERQPAADLLGAPALAVGSEYVLFLWAGASGNRQVIGFSQGAFDVKLDAKGNPQMQRSATSETMLDDRGREVGDVPVRMSLTDLRKLLKSSLGNQAGAGGRGVADAEELARGGTDGRRPERKPTITSCISRRGRVRTHRFRKV